MTSYVADAHAHVQRLVSVVKMVTVIEECATEGQHSVLCVCVFLWAYGLNTKDVHTENVPVYCGKCLLCSRFVANVSLMTKEVETEVRKWLIQHFDALVSNGTSVPMSVEDI
jgi:hypothetical protein